MFFWCSCCCPCRWILSPCCVEVSHCLNKNGVYYLQLLHSIISISKNLFKWPLKTNQDLVNDPQQNGQVINNQPLIFFVTFRLIFTRNDWPTVSSEARHYNSLFQYPNTVKFAKTWIFNQTCSWWQKIRWKPVSCLIYMYYYPNFNPKGDQTQNSTIFLTFTLLWHWKIMKNI